MQLVLAGVGALVLVGLVSGSMFAMIRGLSGTGQTTGSVRARSTATATHVRATATPTATLAPAPVPALTLAPTTLTLSPLSSDNETCGVTQRITNTTGSTVGWSWKSPAISGFHFMLNDHALDQWPRNMKPGIEPGESDTLQILADCNAHHQPVTIQVVDTLGMTYTITVQVAA